MTLNHREILAVLWLFVIGVLAVFPIPKSEGVSGILNIGHVVAYTILTILWEWAWKENNQVFIVSIACVPLTELLQLFTPWREATIIDVAYNMLGVLFGFFVSQCHSRVTRSR